MEKNNPQTIVSPPKVRASNATVETHYENFRHPNMMTEISNDINLNKNASVINEDGFAR